MFFFFLDMGRRSPYSNASWNDCNASNWIYSQLRSGQATNQPRRGGRSFHRPVGSSCLSEQYATHSVPIRRERILSASIFGRSISHLGHHWNCDAHAAHVTAARRFVWQKTHTICAAFKNLADYKPMYKGFRDLKKYVLVIRVLVLTNKGECI